MKPASLKQKERVMEIMKDRQGSYPTWESLDNLTAKQAYTIIAEHYKKWENLKK